MTDLEKKIADLRKWIFLLQMKDRWTSADYDDMAEMRKELRDLERKMAEA
jgi:hypothetical protein